MSESFPLPYTDPALGGKVALVTGAAGALGTRFARTLASAGASVALADIRTHELRAVQAAVEADGAKCVSLGLDLTKPGTIPSAVDEITEALGAVDILVNNAGVNDPGRPHKAPLAMMQLAVSTNLLGPYVLSCEVARRMIDDGRSGRIVNISSMSAYSYHSMSASPLYSITKAAVVRMTEVLAVEWARYHINVNALAPGVFWSEMTEGMVERIGDPSETMPRKRLGHPPQLDTSLLYLVGAASEFVTGTVIKVDDGQKPR